jgi:SAM-dependent methyltransferase
MNYQNTPSFYNNEDFFNQYLGCTSYYNGLQNVVKKIIKITNAHRVLELGSALGTTTLAMAKEYPNIMFSGSDIRDNAVIQANEKAKEFGNVFFIQADMCEHVKLDTLSEFDLIFLLYSFHHILDPLENKIRFLKNCYANMKAGSYLLITETFLPEDAEDLKENLQIKRLFDQRAVEGYASTFWAALNSLKEVEIAKEVANVSFKEELEAGHLVNERKEEYLVKFSWLVETASACGFKVIIAEPVNSIMEKALLLQK